MPLLFSRRFVVIASFIFIITIAALFRLIALDVAPAGGHGDVSWIGVNALDWIDHGIWQFYIRELYAPEFFPVYLTGFLIPLTGISYLPQRLITALAGVLFVAFLYPAVYWFIGDTRTSSFRERAGLFASFAGAISLHVVSIQRLGMESPPFLTALTLLTWWTGWAWQRGKWWRWALAGAALALAQYVYLPARLLPIVLALWMVHARLTDRARFRTEWRGLLIMAIVSFILTLPALILFIQSPETFSARADTGTASTGGWIWQYDTSGYGGVWGLMFAKVGLVLQALGAHFNGAYNIMNLPILSPVFFVGFMIAFLTMIRHPRWRATMWCFLAIPPLLITDIISGSFPELHALHQMGILPFIYMLSGIGMAVGWDVVKHLTSRLSSSLRHGVTLALGGGILVSALMVSSADMRNYLQVFIPGQYANPQSTWQLNQTDVDLARTIIAQPQHAYLLPVSEYTRPDVAWLLAAEFRERRSAIGSDGKSAVTSPPTMFTVVQSEQPERARHDGRPTHLDPRLWVLLYEDTVWLLPPLSQTQVDNITERQAATEPETIIDASGTEIAQFYTFATPDDLFNPDFGVEKTLDETFADAVRLVGYDVPAQDLTLGQGFYVTLYWQTTGQAMTEDYEVFAQLWDDTSQSIASTHDFPWSGFYRSRIWRTDEIVPTHHWLEIPSQLSIGRYSLVTGLFRQLQNERVVVNGMHANSQDGIVIVPDFRLPPAPITTVYAPLDAPIRFGNRLALEGLQISVGHQAVISNVISAVRGAEITFDFTWLTLERMTRDYHLFLHITRDNEPSPTVQLDIPLSDLLPTASWLPGERYIDQAIISLPMDLDAGGYEIYLGIYDWQSGERLIIEDELATNDRRLLVKRLLVQEG